MTKEKKRAERRQSFEEAMKNLESVVERMEAGELTLDESLKLFEEGIRLAQFCNSALEEAKKKVEVLTKDIQGTVTLTPFEETQEE